MSERTLARAMQSLAPVKDKLIVVGGTAHRLFPMHELGCDPVFELLSTEDVDLAAPLELRFDESRDLLNRLGASGFTEEVRGAEYSTHIYRLSEEGGAYLQFIAPLKGDGLKRDGRKDRIMRFSGIQAEKLRHVDVLLHKPWTLSLPIDSNDHEVHVVNPVAYLVQKLLVLPSRGTKQGKDLLYVFDTLSIFADSLEQLGIESVDLIGKLSARATSKIRNTVQELCFIETRVSREAAYIAAEQRDRPPDSSQIVLACQLGLRRILKNLIPML